MFFDITWSYIITICLKFHCGTTDFFCSLAHLHSQLFPSLVLFILYIFLDCNLYCVCSCCWMNTVAWCYLLGNTIKSPVGSLRLLLLVIRFVLWHPAIVPTRSLMPHRSATAPGSNGSAYVLLQASCVQYSWVPLTLMWKRQLWQKSVDIMSADNSYTKQWTMLVLFVLCVIIEKM